MTATSRRRVARSVLPVLLALLCVPAAVSAGATPAASTNRTSAASPRAASTSAPPATKKQVKKKAKRRAKKRVTPAPGSAPEPQPAPAVTIFDDEFSGPEGAAPSSAWTPQTPFIEGYGSVETNTSARANSSLDGHGDLLITAQRAGSPGRYTYTSARLVTPAAYGPVMHVTARIRMPDQRGTWPTFCLLGGAPSGTDWPHKGEVDVAEVQGSANPQVVYLSAHGSSAKPLVPGIDATRAGGDHWKSAGPVTTGVNEAAGFHNYGVTITADTITWTFDHVVVKVLHKSDLTGDEQWSFTYAMHVVLNLSLGGSFVGPVPDDDVFPTSMVVDYVRVTR